MLWYCFAADISMSALCQSDDFLEVAFRLVVASLTQLTLTTVSAQCKTLCMNLLAR